MVIRHRSIEQKLRVLSGLFGDSLIVPLQEKIDEWKKSVNHFDKENSKEYKQAKQDLKKVGSETVRLRKKVNKKGKFGQKERLEAVMKMASAQFGVFEEHQKRALRKVLIEERSRYCILLNLFQPVVEQEVSLLSDAENLSALLQEAARQCEKPNNLPDAGEHMIEDFKLSESGFLDEQLTPPSSPSNHRRQHSYSVSSGASSRSSSPSSRVGSPEKGTLTRSKSMSAASHRPAPPVRRSSVLSPQRENYMEKHLGMSRLSISSQDSATNQSYYSSMSSLDSQSVDYLPPPPAPVLPPAPPSPNPSEVSLPPPPSMEEILRERACQKSRTVDSGFYSSMSSSLDRSPSTSLAQVPYDDNDSGHYEAVVPYEPGTPGDPDGYYENPQYVSPHVKTYRSNSESMTSRVHGVHFQKRSMSYNEAERFDRNDIAVQHLRRVAFQDPRVKCFDLKTDLSAQIAANAAEVAAHFQRKDDKDDSPVSPGKWRPPVAKKNYFSPPTSPNHSPNFDQFWRQMENPRRGVDNEFLDDNYKARDPSTETTNSFLSQIQRQRSSMKYVAKHQ
ncbi:MTSS1 isoform X1 [Paramuricea clavata]|uniref:MTSS1 isoform X1 n=1 Tax=Paramuricea clavata TaxID=317549 RepID=A0A6S7LKI7_PARCT|nr:MTSS1 isoform X1 [Paramuricea clavata]